MLFNFLVIHIIGSIPGWIWPALAGAGVAIWFISDVIAKFPAVQPYSAAIKPASILITALGIFMYGGEGVAEIYQTQIQDLEKRIAVADQKSIDVTAAVEEKTEEKIKVINHDRIVYRDRIKEVEKLIDTECKIDKSALDILNDAAANPLKGIK
jgi:hypothetical protein